MDSAKRQESTAARAANDEDRYVDNPIPVGLMELSRVFHGGPGAPTFKVRDKKSRKLEERKVRFTLEAVHVYSKILHVMDGEAPKAIGVVVQLTKADLAKSLHFSPSQVDRGIDKLCEFRLMRFLRRERYGVVYRVYDYRVLVRMMEVATPQPQQCFEFMKVIRTKGAVTLRITAGESDEDGPAQGELFPRNETRASAGASEGLNSGCANETHASADGCAGLSAQVAQPRARDHAKTPPIGNKNQEKPIGASPKNQRQYQNQESAPLRLNADGRTASNRPEQLGDVIESITAYGRSVSVDKQREALAARLAAVANETVDWWAAVDCARNVFASQIDAEEVERAADEVEAGKKAGKVTNPGGLLQTRLAKIHHVAGVPWGRDGLKRKPT